MPNPGPPSLGEKNEVQNRGWVASRAGILTRVNSNIRPNSGCGLLFTRTKSTGRGCLGGQTVRARFGAGATASERSSTTASNLSQSRPKVQLTSFSTATGRVCEALGPIAGAIGRSVAGAAMPPKKKRNGLATGERPPRILHRNSKATLLLPFCSGPT
jgi:hypothetical protein